MVIENPRSSIQSKIHGQTQVYSIQIHGHPNQVAALTVRFGRLTEEYQGFKVKGYVNEEKSCKICFSGKN